MQWNLYEDIAASYETFRWLRDEAPVYKMPTHGHYAISRFDDVTAVLLDWRTFGSQLTAFPRPEHLPIITDDPPKHDERRAVIGKAFAPREVEKLEPMVRRIVTRRLNEFADKGWADLVGEFSQLVPGDVIGEMLGVEEADREPFRRWAPELLSRDPAQAAAPEIAHRAIESIRGYFIAQRPGRDSNPRDDLITLISHAKIRGRRMSDHDYAAMCATVAVAGYETTAHLITHALVELHRHPEQRAWLCQHPGAIPNAVKEVLRYRTPVPVTGRMGSSATSSYTA